MTTSKGDSQDWIKSVDQRDPSFEPDLEQMREIIAMQAVDIKALEAEKEELRQMLIKARGLLLDGVNKYKVLFAHCEEQDTLIRAMKTGDDSELRDRGSLN